MVFGLFGGAKPTPKNIDKQMTRVKERYAQPEFRRAAMDQLLEWGTPEAFDALLKRFTVVVQSPHWDEEEKRWLSGVLAEHGEEAKAALIRFLAKENHIAYAAKALHRLCTSDDELVEHLIEALKARAPDDHRTVQGKQELVAALGQRASPEQLAVVVAYLDDHSDDVQCAAVDVIKDRQVTAGYDRLREMICEDIHSARVVRQAAAAVAALKLPIDPQKALEPAVTEDFVVKEGTLAPNRSGG
jgi:HEAT repeat protein